MSITKFDRNACRIVRARLEEVLAEAGIEGVEFEVGNMSFLPNQLTIKVVGKTEGAADDQHDLLVSMTRLDNIGSLEKNGWKIIEYHSKKPKYPYIVTDGRGKRFKMTPGQARMQFGAAQGVN